jgi:hypothetical protein
MIIRGVKTEGDKFTIYIMLSSNDLRLLKIGKGVDNVFNGHYFRIVLTDGEKPKKSHIYALDKHYVSRRQIKK